MKAREYLERKRRAKGRPTWRYVPGTAPAVVSTDSSLIVSGTTSDIDTPEKRRRIARSVLAMAAAFAAKDEP